MARRMRSRRRTTRTRRRRPCDILPLNLCAQTLVVDPPGPDENWSCLNPKNFELILLDGGALDEILREQNPQSFYEGGQATTRGISFLGAEFWLRASLNEDLSQFLTDTYRIFEIRLACGLVKREWSFDSVNAARVNPPLPNLFQRDETGVGEVLYRWPLYLGPVAMYSHQDPAVAGTLNYADTQGGTAQLVASTTNQAALQSVVSSGAASSNQFHHKVRNRRFLDEDHYLSLCFSFSWGIVGTDQTDVFGLGIEANGLIKARAR